MANSIKFALCLVVAMCAVQLVSAGFGDMLTSFFDRSRVSRCPRPGTEFEYDQEITIKTMNFPREPCVAFCAARDLISQEGQEQISYGPKLFCCCKPQEDEEGDSSFIDDAITGIDMAEEAAEMFE